MENTKKLLVLFSGGAEEHSARRGLLLHVMYSVLVIIFLMTCESCLVMTMLRIAS